MAEEEEGKTSKDEDETCKGDDEGEFGSPIGEHEIEEWGGKWGLELSLLTQRIQLLVGLFYKFNMGDQTPRKLVKGLRKSHRASNYS